MNLVLSAQVPQLLQQDAEWVQVVPPAIADTREDSLARFKLSIPAGLSGEPYASVDTPADDHLARTLKH